MRSIRLSKEPRDTIRPTPNKAIRPRRMTLNGIFLCWKQSMMNMIQRGHVADKTAAVGALACWIQRKQVIWHSTITMPKITVSLRSIHRFQGGKSHGRLLKKSKKKKNKAGYQHPRCHHLPRCEVELVDEILRGNAHSSPKNAGQQRQNNAFNSAIHILILYLRQSKKESKSKNCKRIKLRPFGRVGSRTFLPRKKEGPCSLLFRNK